MHANDPPFRLTLSFSLFSDQVVPHGDSRYRRGAFVLANPGPEELPTCFFVFIKECAHGDSWTLAFRCERRRAFPSLVGAPSRIGFFSPSIPFISFPEF